MLCLSLSQLNALVANEIKSGFADLQWITAETSDVRYNKNGHCYLELIEKQPNNQTIIAKARAYIWSNTFQLLKSYFEEKTGQSFVSGLKIRVQVAVEFHSVYGYGLNICDIDPIYTLGDMQQHRQQILAQLEEDGVLNLNKELEMPLLPQRIAIITSPTAAGYEDFLEHLQNNENGFVFYPHLFPAIMQGEQTESSIIAALNRIHEHSDCFDLVVIIRGGGATSDLASFDTYRLASNVAQFPLPIITGIGHERDDTVLDFVSYHRAKTPTAAADYLVSQLTETVLDLYETQEKIRQSILQQLDSAHDRLQSFTRYLPLFVRNKIEIQQNNLNLLQNKILQSHKQILSQTASQLQEKEVFMKLSSPEYILAKGYSITRKNGKTVTSRASLQEGDLLETIWVDGSATSRIESFA